MKIEELYSKFLECNGISTDTRKIIPGSIFFALKGETFDGNTFASKSLELGAKYAIVDNPDFAGSKNCILVENTLETLQKLANYHRKLLKINIIGITGTNGKTTTKELINAVLSQKFKVGSTKGNLNNHIGVPLTLLSFTRETQLGIVEMGANHPGEIEQLCNIAEPNLGIITNIGKAHLEGFGSFEGVIKTKSELYKFLEKNKGTIIYNSENKILKANINSDKTFKYGKETHSDLLVKNVHAKPFCSVSYSLLQENYKNEYLIESKLIGIYNSENIAAAAAVGVYFNIDNQLILNAIKNYSPDNSRSQLMKTANNLVVLDAYNANPTSVENALNNFSEMEAEKKVIILGDMLELGEYSEIEHKNILQLSLSFPFNKRFFVGKVYSSLINQNDIKTFLNVEDFYNFLKINKIENSTILVKGSRGIHLEKIVELL